MLLGHGFGQVLRLGGNLIMTRLLVPEMFGVMAIATAVNITLNMLSDMGVRQKIVQSERGDDSVFLDTAWVLQILRGCLLWLISLALSAGLFAANAAGWVPADSVYASPILPSVVAVTSFSLVITAFQSTKMATAWRKLDQKRSIQIVLASQVAGLAVMIVIGLASRSIWALVAGALLAATVTTLLSHVWMPGHQNRFRHNKEAASELLSFGRWVFLSSGLHVLAVNGDRLILGLFLEASVLGLYAIAILIVSAIAGTLERLYGATSLPVLSEVARDTPERLQSIYNKFAVPGDILAMALVGLLFATGRLLIDALYDSRYAGAGPMVEILALSLFGLRYEISRQVYLALGRPKLIMWISFVRFVSLCIVIPVAYHLWGTTAVVWGVALHGLAVVPVVYLFNSRLQLNDMRREVFAFGALGLGFAGGYGLRFALQ